MNLLFRECRHAGSFVIYTHTCNNGGQKLTLTMMRTIVCQKRVKIYKWQKGSQREIKSKSIAFIVAHWDWVKVNTDVSKRNQLIIQMPETPAGSKTHHGPLQIKQNIIYWYKVLLWLSWLFIKLWDAENIYYRWARFSKGECSTISVKGDTQRLIHQEP